eukprot:g2410.t1
MDARKETRDTSVTPTLVWVGFFFIIFGVSGVIGLASSINWVLGFLVTIFVALTVTKFALIFDRANTSGHYTKPIGCSFSIVIFLILIALVYLPIFLIGDGSYLSSSNSSSGGTRNEKKIIWPWLDASTLQITPGKTPDDVLLSWYDNDVCDKNVGEPLQVIDGVYIYYGKRLKTTDTFTNKCRDKTEFLHGVYRSDGKGEERLAFKVGSPAEFVYSPRNFIKFKSKIYFTATVKTAEFSDTQDHLWSIEAGQISLVFPIDKLSPSSNHYPKYEANKFLGKSLLVRNDSLWYRGLNSNWNWNEPRSVFHWSGNSSEQPSMLAESVGKNPPLRSNSPKTCGSSGCSNTTNSNTNREATAWGVFGIACIPHFILSLYSFKYLENVNLKRSKISNGQTGRLLDTSPLILNILLGGLLVATSFYIAVTEKFNDDDGFSTFLKRFNLVYALFLFLLSVFGTAMGKLSQSHCRWVVNFATILFFSSLHALTEVPVEDGFIPYFFYNGGLLLLIFITLLTLNGLPMICAGIGITITVFRLTRLFSNLIGENEGAILGMLRFFVTSAMGVLLLILSALFAKHRELIERKVDNFYNSFGFVGRRFSGVSHRDDVLKVAELVVGEEVESGEAENTKN